MGEDELAEGVIHREAVDAAAAHGDDELGAGAVHGEARGDELGAGDEEVFFRALCALGQLEDAEDGADGDAGVEVGGAVDGVADDGVAGVRRVREDDGFFFLFGDEDAAFARGAHGADEEVVPDDVELLLVVAGDVGGAGEAGQVDERGASDVVGYGFEGELEGVAEEAVFGRLVAIWSVGFSWGEGGADVKSPVASLCLPCSSVRKRVRVTMSVLIFSLDTGAVWPLLPLAVAMVDE